MRSVLPFIMILSFVLYYVFYETIEAYRDRIIVNPLVKSGALRVITMADTDIIQRPTIPPGQDNLYNDYFQFSDGGPVNGVVNESLFTSEQMRKQYGPLGWIN